MLTYIKSFLRNNWLAILFIIFYSFIQYYFFFKDGTMILGSEGHYWQDFHLYLQNQGKAWLNSGTGEINTSMNAFFVYPFIFSFIKNVTLQSYLICIIIYLAPFISMYLLLADLKKSRIMAALFAFFYIANPFTIIYLVAINPWNVNILFTYPIFLYIFYKWYDKFIPLFFILGVISCLLAYTLTNPPQMVLFVLSQPFFIFIASLLRNKKFTWISYAKNVITIALSFLLFNIWWVRHWLIVLPDTQKIYTFKFAKAWLTNQAVMTPMILKNIFSFLWLNPRATDYSRLADYFNHPVIQILMYFPFIAIFIWIIQEMKTSQHRKLIGILFAGMLVLVLFLKGINPPFANLISACFDYVKYCYIFKTAPEKFGVVFAFLTTIVLFFIISETKIRWLRIGMYLYLFLLLIPFIGGFYLPDIKANTNMYATRKYKDFPEFQRFKKTMAERKLDFRLLSLPNSGNYQVLMHLYGNKYYTGHNPLMMNIPQSYIADHTSDDYIPLFANFDSKVTKKLLGIFSIRYISFNTRIRTWFGNFTGKTNAELQVILDRDYKKTYNDHDISLYENTDFLPHFWIPDSVIPIEATSTLADMAKILEQFNPSMNVAFLSQNLTVGTSIPVVEYKRIDSTKYRLVIHGISEPVPLIFSEKFHNNWFLYSKKINPLFSSNESLDLSKYQIFHNNESDQASKESVELFRKNGWISTNNNANYISKKFATSIQNDNLPNGTIFETDNDQQAIQVATKTHMLANTYANAWILDPSVCTNDWCKKNNDGSYDMEFVLQFWPQKALYRSFIYTAIIFTVSSVVFIIWAIKTYKKKHISNIHHS